MPHHRQLTPIGYQWIAQHYEAEPIPHFVESYLALPGVRIREQGRGRSREIYPHTQYSPNTVFDHLEFALKREGLHLELLRLILPKIPEDEMIDFIRSKPTGSNVRRVWYLYEQFTGKNLPIPDMSFGNYVDLIDP
jgi:hypothetical protein